MVHAFIEWQHSRERLGTYLLVNSAALSKSMVYFIAYIEVYLQVQNRAMQI